MGIGSFFKRNKKETQAEDSHIAININECDACEKCIIACPNNVLHLTNDKSSVRNPLVCKRCKVCMSICPNECIEVK